MDINPYVVDHKHVDTISGVFLSMAHDMDAVTLREPITVALWYIHADPEIPMGMPRTMTAPELVSIPSGETRTFELVEHRGDHPGDWNMDFWFISVDG